VGKNTGLKSISLTVLLNSILDKTIQSNKT